MREFCLSKNDTAVLKSIGIFLIVFSHALGFPMWYADGLTFEQLNDYTAYIRRFMMYAYVPMFAFLTGYTYKLKEDLSWRYILKKIIGFLLDYYFIFTLLFMFAFFSCDYIPSFSQICKELYPVSATLMIFAWYVPFYCEAMLTLRVLGIFVKKYDIKKSIYVCIFVFLVLEVLIGTLKNIGLRGDMLVKALQDFKRYVPFVIMGYFFAHGKYFNVVAEKWGGKRICGKTGFITVLVFIAIVSMFNYKILGLESGIIYTPIYIYCMCSLRIGDCEIIGDIAKFISKHAANIWFIHCIFFSEITRDTFQYIAFIPKNPLLIVFWIIVICSFVSVLIMPLQKRVKELITGML